MFGVHLEHLGLLRLSAYRDVVRERMIAGGGLADSCFLIFNFLRSIDGVHTARTRTSKACIEKRNPPWKLSIKLLLNYSYLPGGESIAW